MVHYVCNNVVPCLAAHVLSALAVRSLQLFMDGTVHCCAQCDWLAQTGFTCVLPLELPCSWILLQRAQSAAAKMLSHSLRSPVSVLGSYLCPISSARQACCILGIQQRIYGWFVVWLLWHMHGHECVAGDTSVKAALGSQHQALQM